MTTVDLQQSEHDIQATSSEQQNNTFPRHNLIFHCSAISSDDDDSEKEFYTENEFLIQVDSGRIHTPISLLKNDDSLKSPLQFVSEEHIEPTQSSLENRSPTNFDFMQQTDVWDTEEMHTNEENLESE